MDRKDARTLGLGIVYGLLLLVAAGVVGLAVRVFLFAAFGGG